MHSAGASIASLIMLPADPSQGIGTDGGGVGHARLGYGCECVGSTYVGVDGDWVEWPG